MTQPTPITQTRLRDRLPLAPQREAGFRWRGTEVSRVEGFTDAVFAFAVTLLVVALEVPHSFEGLMDVVRGFPAFVICFALLMTFWNAHYRFHRRYGMEDVPTRIYTMAIIVLVLFFVYPLKFLFTMVTVNMFGLALHDAPKVQTMEQLRVLYTVYGLGFAGVWGLYATLYMHAWRNREQLGLDEVERLYTKSGIAEHLIFVGVCLLSIATAWAVSEERASWPGFVYVLLGPIQTLSGWLYGRKIRALTARTAS